MATGVTTGDAFSVWAPPELFQTSLPTPELRRTAAVADNGQRFLLDVPDAGSKAPLTIVPDRPALLQQR